MRLLEREHILTSLAEYARTAKSGGGRLVLVSGEAGVGKSAVLDAIRARLPGARWVQGACDGLFTPRPLGPLFDVAEQFGGGLLDACRAGAARDELFARLLRVLGEPGDLTVLAVEDAHWADESTLDLVRFLGARIRDITALLIVTYRDDGLAATDPLRIVIGELTGLRSTRRVSLSPLSPDAVAVLANGSGFEPAELYRLTGGNPFFVTEIVRSGALVIPPSARDAVLARVARLSANARHAVEAAALIGGAVEPHLLGAVSGSTETDLDLLVAAGLLASDGASLRFRHEITRLTVDEQVPAHRRAAIHAHALAALLKAGCEDDARLAYHAEGAGDRDATLRFAPRAARRATSLAAHREAAAQYERALRFADDRQDATVAELCDRLAGEYSLIDRFEDAATVQQRAIALWRQVGDPLREGDTMRRLAKTLWRLCRGAEERSMAGAALARLQPLGPSRELAWAYTTRAGGEADSARAIDDLHAAERLAEQLDLPDVLSCVLNYMGWLTALLGGDGHELLERALRVALDAGDAENAGRAYANRLELLVCEMRLAEAEPWYEDGVAYCDAQDMNTYVTCLRGWHSVALDLQGRWDEAVAICEPALRIIASPVNRLTSLLALGRIRARRGDPPAWQCLDEVLTRALATADTDWIVPARLARAEAHWLSDDLPAARDELEAAAQHATTMSRWKRGPLITWLRRTGSPLPAPTGPVAEPYALSLAGRFDEASAVWDRLGCPYEAALAVFDTQTEAGLREALRRFEALGARGAAQATRRAMRRLRIRYVPAGARAATRTHPAGLTRREREVLDLICSGYTNAQIAQHLVLSERTVDHHVSAVLTKLGVPSRTVAATEAARLGLVGAEN